MRLYKWASPVRDAYAIGGTQDYGTTSGGVEVYNPGTNTWTSRAPMLTPRIRPTVFSAGGKVYTLGGDPAGTGSLSIVEVYDPATNSWASLPAAPVPGVGHAVAVTARGGELPVRWLPGMLLLLSPERLPVRPDHRHLHTAGGHAARC